MKKILLILTATVLPLASICAACTAGAGGYALQGDERTERPLITTEEIAPGVNVKTLDAAVRGADVLSTIKSEYAGRVALIDFWATWCGPCRMAMKQIDTIKPDLATRGVAFVYITGETSPLAAWQGAIPAITGDHYRLTADQWNDLCSAERMVGIPAYLLLNADGTIAFSNLTTGGYPGNDAIQQHIEVALTK